MKPSSWDKQLGLASPLECAASQSGQTNNPSKECGGAGCKSPYPHLPEGRGEAFFLDILFHRMSVIAIFRQRFEKESRHSGSPWLSEQLVSCPGDNESMDRSACPRSVEPCAGFTDTRQRNTAYEFTGTAY